MRSRFLDVVITDIRELTPRIREYRLTSYDRSPLPAYQAGAHIELYLRPGNGTITRHYSLIGGTSAEDDPPETYRIAVLRANGAGGSAHIHDRFRTGTTLKISHPKNHFPLSQSGGKTLLIAGGIGITPIFAMLRSLARRKCNFELVYSGCDERSLAYREDVVRIAGPNATFHFSRSNPNQRLDIRALLGRQPEASRVYVCGPSGMIEATRQAAKSLGWDPIRVRSELFAAGSKENDCEFDVELGRSRRTIRVGRNTSILDALTSAGVDALADCRRGECGLCPLKVIETDGSIDHRDRYLSPEVRESGKTLCICVSRIYGSRLKLDA